MMNIEDFTWIWQGIDQGPLLPSEIHLLQPIAHSSVKKEKALLLIHGFSSSPAVFRHLIPALMDVYDGIFAPVLPGHAESLQTFSQTPASNWIKFIMQYGHQLTQQYEQVDVLGLSLGGLLAYQLSTQCNIRHLYLLAPAFHLHIPARLGLALASIYKAVGIQSIRNRGGNIQHPGEKELTYRQLPITAIQTILNYIRSFSLTPLSCSIDLFLGQHDAVVNSTQVAHRFIQSSLQTKIHWLNHSAHVLPLDADKQRIITVIQNKGSL